jgi:hypothetical protein
MRLAGEDATGAVGIAMDGLAVDKTDEIDIVKQRR